eukprot:8453204-Karenia_brevis.AAC.1
METQCIYWGLIEHPSWLRARKHGYYPFSYIDTRVQNNVVGGLSCIVKEILKVFFSSNGLNFEKLGMDLKAMQCMLNWKGSGSWKCCTDCRNIMKVVPGKQPILDRHPYLQEYSKAKPHDFDPLTSADIYQIIDDLAIQKTLVGKTKFGECEKAHGFNFNPDGLLCDAHVRTFFLPKEHF